MGTFHCLSSCVCCLLLVSWLRVIRWGRMLFDLVWHLCVVLDCILEFAVSWVSWPVSATCLPEEGIGEVLEKEDSMQALSGQIFMGMVSSQYQARLDIVRLIDGLVNACIRFVYFSLEDELKSKVGRATPLAATEPCSHGIWGWPLCSLPSVFCRCLQKRWAWRQAGTATFPSRPMATCLALRSPPPAPATLAPCTMS